MCASYVTLRSHPDVSPRVLTVSAAMVHPVRMADEQQYIDPDEVGHWEGNTFVLDTPVTNANVGFRRITIDENASFGDGITREDVVHAMLNSAPPLDE